MAEDKRTFTVEQNDGKSVELTTRAPSNEELQKSEFEYSKEFNKAIVNGILPQARLISELVSNGVWSEDKDQAIEEQREKVIEMESKLQEIENEDEKKAFSESLAKQRQALLDMRQEKNDMLAHSAEIKAENAQRNFLVSQVTEYKQSGAKVWKDYKAFQEEEDGNKLFLATYEYLTFINGLPSNFAEQLPENQVEVETSDEEASAEEAPVEEVIAETPAEAPVETPVEEVPSSVGEGDVSARVEQ